MNTLVVGRTGPNGFAKTHSMATDQSRALWPALLLGVAAAVSLRGGGHYTASDILSIAVLPASLPAIGRQRFARGLIAVSGMWALAQVVSDILNGSPLALTDATTPLLICTTFLMVAWLHRAYRTPVELLLVGVAAGGIVRSLVFQGALGAAHPWKFFFALPFAIIVLVALRVDGSRPIQLALVVSGLIAADYLGDFRSGIGFLVVALVLAARLPLRERNIVSPTPPHRARVLIIAAATIAALYVVYPSLALSGLLGNRAQTQQSQVVASHANLLLFARPEILQAAFIAVRHPLLGIGTKTPLSQGEFNESLAFVQRSGVSLDKNEVTFFEGPDRTGLVTHSMALDALDHAGVFALPFWVLLAVLSARGIARAREIVGPLGFLTALLGLSTLWDILFSPMTASNHVAMGAYLTVLWRVLGDEGATSPLKERAA